MPEPIKQAKPKIPALIKLLIWLFIVNAALWLAYGGLALFAPTDNAGQAVVFLIIAILMIVDAIVLSVIAWGINKQKRWAFFLGIGMTIVNIILSITDKLDIYDIIILIVNIVLLALLFYIRPYFIPRRPQ